MMVALIKPQFELSRPEVGRGGIVRDEAARTRAVDKIRDFTLAAGWSWRGVVDSPIAGADGNREFLCLIEP
jgi:23S rRNA (cytidine1920-2'-O)/16S rRNA (cytidine1409-2'-O)-methyltransferase